MFTKQVQEPIQQVQANNSYAIIFRSISISIINSNLPEYDILRFFFLRIYWRFCDIGL